MTETGMSASESADAEPMVFDIKAIRKELGLSQSELAAQIGASTRAIQSYEQGWRRVSEWTERLLVLLLVAHRNGPNLGQRVCWDTVKCAPAIRERCIAYKTRQGHLCWFLTGTICRGKRTTNWAAKKHICAQCSFMVSLLNPTSETQPKA